MNVCPHLVGLCKLKGCEKCDFMDDISRCPKAHSASGEDLTPTFGWVLDVVNKNVDMSRAYRRNVVNSIDADIRSVGLDRDCRLSMMTRGKFKTLIQLLTARGIAPISIRARLNYFSSICSEKMESVYENAGYELTAFSIPAYEVPIKSPQDVPERAVAKFRKLMGKWAEEGNTQLYIAAWFGLNAGMRWGDVCRIKWSVFVQTIDGVFISYTPHKTERKTNAQVSFRVDPEAYLDIEPYIGKDDSFVLVRHEGRCRSGQKVHGDYANLHRSLHNRINAALKSCGIGVAKDEKRFHALRKRFDTRNAQRLGVAEAARMSGHSVEVAKRNYIGSACGRWA